MYTSGFRDFARKLAAIAAMVVIAGCDDGPGGDPIQAARAAITKKDYQTALVTLKAAIVAQPQSVEPRLLLGDLLLRQGDALGALVELGKIDEAGGHRDQLLPLLTSAMLAAGRPKKLIEQFAQTQLSTPSLTAELRTTVAAAYAALGDFQRCEASIDEALKLDPGHRPALLMQARLTAGKGDFDAALSIVDRVLAVDERSTAAWLLKAQLLTFGKNDTVAADRAYRQAISIDPSFLPAHTGLIELLRSRDDLPAFKAQIEVLAKTAPQRPETLFYVAMLAVAENDLKRAREGVQRLLVLLPGFVPGLQLSGMVALRMGEFAQAQTLLSQALQQSPNLPQARRLLAEAQLRSGQPAKSIFTLQPLLQGPAPAAADLAAAADAHLQAGDLATAEKLFSQASKASPEDSRPKVALALAQLAKGNDMVGLQELKSLSASDKSAFADLALATALIQRRELDAALQAIDQLQSKLVGKPTAHLMRARVQSMQMDQAGARASLDKALAIDPHNFAVLAELAALDLAQGRPDAALKRYEAAAARDPQNVLAALAVIDIKGRTGSKPADVAALLQEASRRFPAEAAPRLALVQHYLDTRKAQAALAAAQAADSAVPNDVRILDALGRAQLAAGDARQAIHSLQKAAGLSSQPEPFLRLAEVLASMGDHGAAQANLQRALQMSPRHPGVARVQINLALARGKAADALKVARTVQLQRPTEAAGYLLEAGIHVRQRAWSGATAAYRAALEREPASGTARQLHAMLTANGQRAEADSFAGRWLAERPGDTDFLIYLGSLAIQNKDLALAESHFQKVLATLPEHPLALNNTAALLLQQGKPGALALAEKAVGLAPERAAYLDTLATALAVEKNWPRAVETQRRAVAIAPDAPALRLNLARHLIDAGEGNKARAELEALAALGQDFPGQAEVAALMKRL